MQRVYVSLVLAGLFQTLSPAPAQAWWEWLDPLSGPKGLKGPQFEARLVCFGNELPANLSGLLSDAAEKMANATTTDVWKDAADSWRKAAPAWNRAAVALGAGSPKDLPTDRDFLKGKNDKEVALLLEATTNKDVKRINSTVISMSSVGVLWSFCSPTKMRRVSIDLGITDLRTDDDRFASGKRLHLTTLIPSVSWRVFNDATYDVVDIGLGAGMYWFSSEGFSAFHGVVLQPYRVDLHAPSSWSSKPPSSPKRWLAVPTLRLGHLLFPAGFEANAFNPGPGTLGQRIPGELVFSKSVFMNLAPLIPRSPL